MLLLLMEGVIGVAHGIHVGHMQAGEVEGEARAEYSTY